MVREAAARLYDVQEDSVVLTKLALAGRYDTGTLTFRAKPGKLIDLDKLHESIWATRLSGGTRSGLVSLEVTAVGEVVAGDQEGEQEQETVLKVAGADDYFVMERHSSDRHQAAFDQLQAALEGSGRIVTVTGYVDGWTGLWPEVLRGLPPRPRRILVTRFDLENSE